MASPTVLVTADTDTDQRQTVAEAVGSGIDVRFLQDVDPDDRPGAVDTADALLSFALHRELSAAAFDQLHGGQVLQTVSAGVDFLPFDRFPDGLTIQSNAGAYAEPMAEHVLALYLALSKRLLIEHRKLTEGEFDQFEPTRRVAGSTCAIFGYGAVGEATARLLKPLDVELLAVNRSGKADEPVEFLGTPEDLDDVLARADGLVVAAPLTPETRGAIDRETLRLLPADGLVINVARGEVIDQGDLYDHLQERPEFQAGIESWWTEPLRHGEFSLEYPLLDLPTVLGLCEGGSKSRGGAVGRKYLRPSSPPCRSRLRKGAPRSRPLKASRSIERPAKGGGVPTGSIECHR